MLIPKLINEFIIIFYWVMNQDRSDFFSQPAGQIPIMLYRNSTVQARQPPQQVQAVITERLVTPSEEQQSNQSGLFEVDRFSRFRQNVQKFPYAGGRHYFFDLTLYQRDKNSVSYVKDDTYNSFKNTFSKDQKMIGGSKIKDIINRQYFTLPSRLKDDQSRPSRAKNPAHQSLFQTEDKKISLDRLILTYRQILNNIEQLTASRKLDYFLCLLRDPKLRQVVSPILSISEKRQILINRLQELVQGKKLCEKQCFSEDNLNMASSRNQKHFQAIRVKLLMFERGRIVSALYSNHYYLKQIIKDLDNDQLINFIEKSFTHYRESNASLKKSTIENIVLNCKDKIMRTYQELSIVKFPIQIISFSNPEILKLTYYILGKAISIKSKYQFYLLNTLCKRLFKISLIAEQQPQIEDNYTFKLDASAHITNIRKMVYKQSPRQVKYDNQNQMLDEEVNYEGLQFENQNIFVLKRGQTLQLSGIQYIILMQWHWLSLIVKEIYPYLKQNPSFIQILASPHYESINQAISEAFKSPLIGTFRYCLQQISQNLIGGEDLNFDDFKIQYEYKQDKSLVILWRTQIEKSQEQGEQQIDYDLLHFGKRIKSLQNQWA